MNSVKHCRDFPKLCRQMDLSDDKIYEILTKAPMSRFYNMDKAELAKIVKRQDAYRHFTYLALQNDRNKSLLDEVSEKNSSKECLSNSIRRDTER